MVLSARKKSRTSSVQESVDYLLSRLVDPGDAFLGKDVNEVWEAIGTGNAYDESSMPYRNEAELATIRKVSRKTARKNPWAENLLRNLVSFTIGKGHTYTVVPKKDAKKPNSKQLKEVQKWLDELLVANKWRRRQREVYRRKHRDGETFIRLFPQRNGITYWRFIEPAQVSTPVEHQAVEYAQYGILTSPEDVEDVEGYYVDGVLIPAYEVQHRKCNADITDLRGLSSIYCVQENLDRGKTLLKSMTMLVTIQTAIAVIRKHNRPASAVRNFSSSKADYTVRDPLTGNDRKFSSFRPGSVIDTNKDTDYEFPTVGVNPAGPVQSLAAELRAIASSKSFPEYMIGSDASNANYSSTMVAESPAVKFFEAEQEDQIEEDLELIWASYEWAVLNGLFPPELKDSIEIEATAPLLISRDPKSQADTHDVYLRHKIISPQTVQAQLGLDPGQEQSNWMEWDDANLVPVQLPVDPEDTTDPTEDPDPDTEDPPTDDDEDSQDPEDNPNPSSGKTQLRVRKSNAKRRGRN